MEIIAAASSVAGILSLLSQSINGATKLRDLFSDIYLASGTISRFLHDIDSLLQALQGAKDVVERLPTDFGGSQVTSLVIQLEYCTKDVYRLLETASSLRPASEVGAKAWFKKFSIAVNSNSLIDAREELERHKLALNLSLTVLGRFVARLRLFMSVLIEMKRTLDTITATNIDQLDKKIDQGTAASLSKIEEQNFILERIEAYTETSIERSAVSDKSLHSIAVSLSRIEALASSAASASMLQKVDGSESPKPRTRPKRRSTGDIPRTRRRSGSSVMSARISTTSAHSLPAVPTIPEKHLSQMEDVRISEISEESQNRSSSCKETQTPWTSVYTDSKRGSIEPFIPAPTIEGNTPSQIAQVDISLHQQHRLFHRLTQETVAVTYSPAVVEYISLIQVIKDYESKISLLHLLNFGSNIAETARFADQSALCESDIFVLEGERNALQNRLRALRDELQACRRRCILEGHTLYQIDNRFGLTSNHNHSILGTESAEKPTLKPTEILSREVHTHGSNLLWGWSSNRDRINRWLLHCLKSDDQQAQLHRSMLADPLPDHEYWARQVLRHWYIDGAAIGEELQISQSVGAVDSHSRESSDLVVGDDEYQRTRLRSRSFSGKTQKTHVSGAIESHGAGVQKVVGGSSGAVLGGSLRGFNFF